MSRTKEELLAAVTAAKTEFKDAVLGKDVRQGMADIADVVYEAVDDQLIEVDDTLATTGEGADAKVVGDLFYANRDRTKNMPTVLTRFTDAANLTSLADMPSWSVATANGAKWKTLVGSNFPNPTALNDSSTYIVTKEQYGSGQNVFYRYTLSSLGRGSIWGGYVTIGGSEIKWAKSAQPTDTTFAVSGAPADAVSVAKSVEQIFENAFEFYSDYEENGGWWLNDGSRSSSTSVHATQLFPIRGGHTYYFGYSWEVSCLGAFFDKAKNWIAPLRGSSAITPDITAVSPSYTGGDNTYLPDQAALDEPDISAYPANGFMTLWKFTAPENAAYFSFNPLGASNANRYRMYIASENIFMPNGSGNIVIPKSDPTYQKYKNKTLCYIGPSTLMINRLWRENANGDMVNPTSTYAFIAGLQEYLKPWFAEVKGMGYSGAALMHGVGATTGKCSIYTRICGGTESYTYSGTERSYTITAPDLSEYDVFIIHSDGNGIAASNVGEYTDTVKTSYSGALRLICDQILTQNPKAEIWLCTFPAPSFTGDGYTIRNNANTQIRALAAEKSFGLIDFAKDGGSNTTNKSYYSYDGTHANNEGNKKNGLFIRKAILGF